MLIATCAKMTVTYTEETDTLLVKLANKKIEDFYRTEHMTVHVDCENNPVLVVIENLKNLVKNLDQLMAEEIKFQLFEKRLVN